MADEMNRQLADRMLIEARAANGPNHASDRLTMHPALVSALAWALHHIDTLQYKWASALEASREDVRAIIREEVMVQLQNYGAIRKAVGEVHTHMKPQDHLGDGKLYWWPVPGSEIEFHNAYDRLATAWFAALKAEGG